MNEGPDDDDVSAARRSATWGKLLDAWDERRKQDALRLVLNAYLFGNLTREESPNVVRRLQQALRELRAAAVGGKVRRAGAMRLERTHAQEVLSTLLMPKRRSGRPKPDYERRIDEAIIMVMEDPIPPEDAPEKKTKTLFGRAELLADDVLPKLQRGLGMPKRRQWDPESILRRYRRLRGPRGA